MFGFFSGFNCNNNDVGSVHNNLAYIINRFFGVYFLIILVVNDFSLSPKFTHLLKHIRETGTDATPLRTEVK